jgi:hypothetical protein
VRVEDPESSDEDALAENDDSMEATTGGAFVDELLLRLRFGAQRQ